MTRYEKIAISLPLRAAESVRRAVKRGLAPSVSAYIAQAIEQREKQESLDALLEEMLAETGGPPTAAERRWARKKLGFGPARKPRRKHGSR
jgi:Arc/MetJ-type ribon-helix-helix transcriptional regulator